MASLKNLVLASGEARFVTERHEPGSGFAGNQARQGGC